jgi:hypothetical protein
LKRWTALVAKTDGRPCSEAKKSRAQWRSILRLFPVDLRIVSTHIFRESPSGFAFAPCVVAMMRLFFLGYRQVIEFDLFYSGQCCRGFERWEEKQIDFARTSALFSDIFTKF